MISQGNLVIIGLVILVLFGAAAIPKFARSIGQAKREFAKGMKEGELEEEQEAQEKKALKSNNDEKI
jgi:TatA/E family protein of Tat protein translocase